MVTAMLISPDTLCLIFVSLCGSALFLRIIGKELRRRDKHLKFRLEEKLAELKKRQEEAARAADEAAEEPASA